MNYEERPTSVLIGDETKSGKGRESEDPAAAKGEERAMAIRVRTGVKAGGDGQPHNHNERQADPGRLR